MSGGSMFRHSFVLALGGAAAAAGASAIIVLASPVPFIMPVSTLEVGRLLEGLPVSRHHVSLAVREARDPGFSERHDDQLAAALKDAIVGAAGVRSNDVRFALSNDRAALDPGLDIVQAEYGRNLVEGDRLYGRDPHFGGLIIGGFRAALRLPDGRWRVVASSASAAGPKWQLGVVKLIFFALIPIIALAVVFGRRLSDPLRRLAASADRIGRGSVEEVAISGPREVRQAAEALNAMQARVAAHVRERTATVAAIAHDLRTPLARLAFLIPGMPDRIRERAEDQVHEMERLIALALEYVQSETVAPARERVDLRSLVEGVIDDAADMGRPATIEPGGAVIVSGDVRLLRRLLANLVENAIIYGGAAHARVRAAGSRALVEIDDEGPGMAADYLSRAFEPFFRAEPSRNAQTGGIGLGLSIVRSVARAHGGEAALENLTPRGLRASVWLPIDAPGDARSALRRPLVENLNDGARSPAS